MASSWPQMPSTGEAVLFCCTAVFMVACALGVLFFRKAAHCAVSMVGVMLGLAVLYFAQGAPFLGAVQIVVYTGAIMMLFLFVIMMIGISASDDYTRQRRVNIVGASVMGAGMMVIVAGVVLKATRPDYVGFSADPYSNQPITDLAQTLFGEHWFTMELSGMLLVTAAIAAMLLTHTDQLTPKLTQRATADATMKAYKERGRRIGQLPTPGVYANSNAVDIPAIAGDTMAPVEDSVSRVLRVKGLDRPLGMVEPAVAQSLQLVRMGEANESPLFGRESSKRVPRSTAWGMPGASAPTGLAQPTAPAARPAEPPVSAQQDDGASPLSGAKPAADPAPRSTAVPAPAAQASDADATEATRESGSAVRETPAPGTPPAPAADGTDTLEDESK